MLPSDYFHRNVFAGFQEDAMGIRGQRQLSSLGGLRQRTGTGSRVA
jgi:hypothetical protein